MISMFALAKLQMGVTQVSHNPAGAKKMWLVKRELPEAGPVRDGMGVILSGLGVDLSQFHGPSLVEVVADMPAQAVPVEMVDFDPVAVPASLSAWTAVSLVRAGAVGSLS